MKMKRHSFVITVFMNRPCSSRAALREARNCIHGRFDCTKLEDGEPEQFRVSGISKLPKGADR